MFLEVGVQELSKLYLELGALGLAFVVLIAIFILTYRTLLKRSTEQSDLIKTLLEKKDEQNAELIKQFVAQITSHVPTPQEAKDANKLSETIDTQLDQLLKDLQASRVVLIQYHNSTTGFSKHSFMKMTCTNEAHVSNVQPLMPTFQNQMKSLFNKSLIILDDVGEYSVENLEDIKDMDESMYWFMSQRQDKQAFHLSIRDKYNNPIGYLLVIYANNNPITQTKEVVIPKMKLTRTVIEYLFNANLED